jgi:hypothetical protein
MEYLIAHIGHTGRHHEHVTWWKPDSRGYTICFDKAGRYSADESADICRHGSSIALRVQDVEPLARSTPYYRLSNGTLGKLYDGGPHRPVPNSRGCWGALMKMRAYPPQQMKVEKPTPIGAKARAIYIDGVPQAA